MLSNLRALNIAEQLYSGEQVNRKPVTAKARPVTATGYAENIANLINNYKLPQNTLENYIKPIKSVMHKTSLPIKMRMLDAAHTLRAWQADEDYRNKALAQEMALAAARAFGGSGGGRGGGGRESQPATLTERIGELTRQALQSSRAKYDIYRAMGSTKPLLDTLYTLYTSPGGNDLKSVGVDLNFIAQALVAEKSNVGKDLDEYIKYMVAHEDPKVSKRATELQALINQEYADYIKKLEIQSQYGNNWIPNVPTIYP